MGFSRQEYWSGLPCLPPAIKPYLALIFHEFSISWTAQMGLVVFFFLRYLGTNPRISTHANSRRVSMTFCLSICYKRYNKCISKNKIISIVRFSCKSPDASALAGGFCITESPWKHICCIHHYIHYILGSSTAPGT